MKTSKKRIDVIDEKLLAPLPIGNGVGDYLRYEPLYDEIREARREEDDTLSQGIWERDLKKADFVLTENLCANALEFRSKDIQIVGWLVESWINLDGFKGFARGIEIIHKMMESYWGNIYPQEEDDFEARIRLFEWMNEQFSNRLMMLPLTYHALSQEKPTLSLSDWILSLNTETIAKRSTDYAKQIQEAESKGKITLSLFKKTLSSTDAIFLQKNLYFCQKSNVAIKAFFEVLAQKLGKQATGFGRIRTCLDDIIRICKTTLEQRGLPLDFDETLPEEVYENSIHESVEVDPKIKEFEQTKEESFIDTSMNIVSSTERAGHTSPHLLDDVMNITGRREAYQALRDIGQFLQNLDPHSPTPSLIELVVSWENKSLPAILEDLSRAPNNTQMLLRMLASALPLPAQ
jgi:type VI secretion system protein ImpA